MINNCISGVRYWVGKKSAFRGSAVRGELKINAMKDFDG
jgi:hypothetical protein